MEYPECEKMAAVQEKSRVLTDFVDWLKLHDMRIILDAYTDGQAALDRLAGKSESEIRHLLLYAGTGQCVCTPCKEHLPREISDFEKLFAKYFKVDLNRVEDERREMLEEIRQGGK